jgi:serine/threonine protein kinase
MRIAVKHLTITDAMSPDEQTIRSNLFREEMRLMSFIAPHPYVMRLSGVSMGEHPLDLALVTDFMCNCDLWRYVNDVESPPLSPMRIMFICAALASALGHCHTQDIIHRDVAARNVFLDRTLTPRLGDFGLACRVNDAVVLDEAPPNKWLAPEAIRDRNYSFKRFAVAET